MVLRCNGRGDTSYDRKDGQTLHQVRWWNYKHFRTIFRWRKSHQLKHLTLTVSSNSLANCWFVRMSSSLSVFLWTAVIIWKKFDINLQLHYNKSNYSQILIGSYLVSTGGGMHKWCHKHFFASLLYKTSRFNVAVHMFHNWLQKKSNLVRTSMTHSCIASCATLLSLKHFDIIWDQLLHIHYVKKISFTLGSNTFHIYLHSWFKIDHTRKCLCVTGIKTFEGR